MKKNAVYLALTLAAAAGLMAGCGSSAEETTAAAQTEAAAETTAAASETEAETEAEAEETEASGEKPFEGQSLTISTFSFNAELLQKNVYDPFMEQTGCELIVEGGKNAERITKIK